MKETEMKLVDLEFHGQWVTGTVIRSFLFMRRVYLTTTRGTYFLVWVPKWKIFS